LYGVLKSILKGSTNPIQYIEPRKECKFSVVSLGSLFSLKNKKIKVRRPMKESSKDVLGKGRGRGSVVSRKIDSWGEN